TSVVPGGTINFHLSSDSPGLANLIVERVGNTPVSAPVAANLSNLPLPAINAWEGFGWPAATSFNIPSNWPTGLYRLPRGPSDVLTFVVRPSNRGTISKTVLHVPFLTPAAYNNAGGKSLYGFNSNPGLDEASRASRVSLDRPGSTPGSNAGEAAIIRWLET